MGILYLEETMLINGVMYYWLSTTNLFVNKSEFQEDWN